MRLSTVQQGAIALGTGAAIAAGFLAFQFINSSNGCVRTRFTTGQSTNGQEVIYSWGCLAPQRFRQWSVTASAASNQLGR